MFTDHQIPIARLDKSRVQKFKYVPEASKLKSLASEIEFRQIEISDFSGSLTAKPEGWDLHAKLKGRATQSCVISDAPVRTDLNITVIRKYRRDMSDVDIDMAHEEDFDDSIETMPQNIELDNLIVESILLNTPEYPKLPKYLSQEVWQFSTEPEEPIVEEITQKPFAGLDKLLNAEENDKEA